MNNYDPNCRFGEHTIQVTIQQWQYKGTIKIKVGGNCRGLAVMENIADSIYDQVDTLESDCRFALLCDETYRAILKDKDGNELLVEEGFEDLEDSIVALEIVDFKPKS